MKPDPKPLADAEIAKYLDDLVRFPSMDWSAASAARMLATIVELKIALRGSKLAKASEIESGGEHPVGRLVHISTASHAWNGVLDAVTPSYFVLRSARLVAETGRMADYSADARPWDDGDELHPSATVRIPRYAVMWMLSW